MSIQETNKLSQPSFLPLFETPNKVPHNAFFKTLKSPLFWLSIAVFGMLGVGVTTAFFPHKVVVIGSVTLALTGVALGILIFSRKRLAYEITLLKERYSRGEWWSKIEHNLYLGALPMEEDRFLLNRMKISDYLCCLESWEFEPSIAGDPIPFKERPSALHLSCPDFTPPTPDQIEQGVNWIKKRLDAGGKVYVHCKGGKGRSALIVACYLIKVRGLTPAAATLHLQNNRPQVTLNKLQLAAMESFSKSLGKETSLPK